MLLQMSPHCSITGLPLSGGMKLSIVRAAGFLFALPACAFAASNVVNLSHYDLMRPDFAAMKSEGIVGVIHEATYPRLDRDAQYAARQQAATQAGLLWGAYHYADATDPVQHVGASRCVVATIWRLARARFRKERSLSRWHDACRSGGCLR